MELRVIVDDVERSISGITETTTCAQIIYALAHATGQKGRFVLTEKTDCSERSLAPHDRPLEILRKSVQAQRIKFILQHLDDDLSISNGIDIDSAQRMAPDRSVAYMGTGSIHSQSLDCELDEQTAVNSKRKYEEIISDPVQCYDNADSVQSSQTHNNELKARSRPPPPSYDTVIEQRFASLARDTPTPLSQFLDGQTTATNDHILTDSLGTLRSFSAETLSNKLSHEELEELVDSQKKIIEQQRLNLARLDLSLGDDHQREVVQLERQQANLRAVLNPLRACDWPGQLQRECDDLQAAITAITDLKHKLGAITEKLEKHSEEERKLLTSINAIIEEIENLENSLSNDDNDESIPMN